MTIHQLLKFESCVERRYLKPPLKLKKVSPSSVSSPHSCPLLITNFFILYFDRKPRVPGQDTGNSSNNSPEDSEALLQWREAVKSSISASQVAVCISQLDRSIAWEKSPMKVVSVCVCVCVCVCCGIVPLETVCSQTRIVQPQSYGGRLFELIYN